MSLSIRDLHNKILDFEGDGLYENIVKVWIVENSYKKYLSTIYEGISSEKQLNLSQDDIWELYALSRILDILTLGFQTNNKSDGSDWLGTDLSLSEYVKFVTSIGLQFENPSIFHSFTCEIIEAKQGEDNFNISKYFFPSVKIGNLMLKKSGVQIILNPETFDLDKVNNACIYWTYRRKNRKYFDLSQGWGNNSQWRTDFRLDIETKEHYVYNQNGKLDLNNITDELIEELNQQSLEIQDAIEITKFRHFIKSTKDDNDLFPYEFRYVEEKPRTTWVCGKRGLTEVTELW